MNNLLCHPSFISILAKHTKKESFERGICGKKSKTKHRLDNVKAPIYSKWMPI